MVFTERSDNAVCIVLCNVYTYMYNICIDTDSTRHVPRGHRLESTSIPTYSFIEIGLMLCINSFRAPFHRSHI